MDGHARYLELEQMRKNVTALEYKIKDLRIDYMLKKRNLRSHIYSFEAWIEGRRW